MNYIDCFLLIFIPRRLSITLGWSDIVSQNIHSWLVYEAAEICDFKAISHVQYENVLAFKSKTLFISILNFFLKKHDNVNININMNDCYSLFLHIGLPFLFMSDTYIKIIMLCVFACSLTPLSLHV